MRIIKRIFETLMRSPYTLPICALVAVISVVYSTYTVKEMMGTFTIREKKLASYDHLTQNDSYISDIISGQESFEQTEDATESVFSTYETIILPEQAPTESIMEEEIATEQQTSAPETQKPTQSTKPQTQKPTQSVTTKPVQKPSGTTSPQSKPVTGWNVTLTQAKKMVKADSAYNYEDLYWLSRIISAEAKGESFTGQIGVGTVVLNRVRSKQFPNSVKGVVFDKKYGTQFTPVSNGTIYHTPTQSAVVAAKMCLDGYTLSDSVLYFLNPAISTSSWIQNNRKYAFRIGNHEFYH